MKLQPFHLFLRRQLGLLFLLVLSVAGQVATGQRAVLDQAEQWFEDRAYAKAIPLFETALEKQPSRKGNNYQQAGLKLAECYRLTGDFQQASHWYAKALDASKVGDDTLLAYYYLQYARVLQIQGKCDSAMRWFSSYGQLKPNDNRSTAGLSSCELVAVQEKAPFDVVNLALNSPANDFGASFGNGELWFSSSRESSRETDPWTGEGYLEMFHSGNWQTEEPTAALLPDPLNSDYHDGPGQSSGNGEQILFTRSRVLTSGRGLERTRSFGLGLFMSRKTGSTWSEPEWINLQTGESLVMHPALSAGGQQLIFASDAPGGAGGFDLYASNMTESGWSEPVWLGPDLNTPGDELYPSLDASGNLWFASDGQTGFGGLDLYIAHARKLEKGWMEPSLLAEPLNSTYDDFGLVWLKTDTIGVLASNRPGGMGGDDLYEVSRNWEAYLGEELALLAERESARNNSGAIVNLLGQTVRSTSGESSGGGVARVIHSADGDTVLVMPVDEDGFFGGPLPAGEAYLLEVEKTNFIADPVILDARDLQSGDQLTVLAEVTEMKEDLVVEMNNIYYDYGKYTIRQDAEPDLDRLLKLLETYPEMTIEISSHTDSRSSSGYNQKLSQRRADAARSYLLKNGIYADRIRAVGYGELRLRNPCSDDVPCSEEDHQFNRRTEFRITFFDAIVDSKPREFAPGTVASPWDIAAARDARNWQQVDADADHIRGWDNPAVAWSTGTWYGVQVGINRSDKSDRYAGFSWLGKIQVEASSQGFYRYVIGYLPSRNEAEQVLGVIREAGILDAFIVTYQNGIRGL